jgi:hypothetical protein
MKKSGLLKRLPLPLKSGRPRADDEERLFSLMVYLWWLMPDADLHRVNAV